MLRLLDVAHLEDHGQRTDLPASVPGFLIGYLAVHGDWVGREAIEALLWPESAPAQAQRALRVSLHRARAWLAQHGLGAGLEAERRRVRLRLDCDVAQLRAAIAQGDWSRAVALHRAPLMDGLALPQHPLAEEWIALERPRLHAAWRRALLREAERLAGQGRAAAAAEMLCAQLDRDPLDEPVLQALEAVAPGAGRSDEARLRRARAAELAPREPGVAVASPAPRAPAASAPAALRSAFVGREAERARIAAAGHALVVVGGPAGIGKTRLLEAALPRAAWFACRDDARHVPLAPVSETLEDTLESLRGLPSFERHRLEIARLVPGAAGGEALPLREADAGAARARLLRALADLLLSLDRPLVFDDLHLADATTLELVEQLLAHGPVALCISLRDGETDPLLERRVAAWCRAPHALRMQLGPLDAASVEAVVRAFEPAHPQAAARATALHRESGGNPLLVVELLRGDAQAGAQAAPRLDVLVQQRVLRLAPAVQRVLGAVAVTGDARMLDLVAQVCGLAPVAVAEALSAAQEAGLMSGRRFGHESLRAAVLQAMPEAVRAVLHAGFARLGGGRLAPHRVAEHWWRAAEPAAAVSARCAACAEDRARGLHHEVLALLQRDADRTHDPVLHGRLQAEMAVTLLQIDDTEAADAEAARLLEMPCDVDTRVTALCVRAEVAFRQGALRSAEAALETAASLAPDRADVLDARTRFALASGRADAALSAMRQHERVLRREGPSAALASLLTGIGAALDEQGDVAEGAPLHREAWAIARQLGARYVQVNVAVNMLWGAPVLGEHERAIAVAREALACGEYDGTPTLRNNLGWLLADLGRTDEAIALYRELAVGSDPTLRCAARAKLVALHAARGDEHAVRDAVADTLTAMTQTDVYIAHAAAMIAVLNHGDAAQAERALAWKRDVRLDPWLQERLDAAVAARRGVRSSEALPSQA